MLRESLIGVVEESLPSKEAGLLLGIVLGEKMGMEAEFWQGLKNSGLVHVVVASGSNLMLLGCIVIENLAWLVGRKKAILIGWMVLWGYVGLTGWQIPALRAGWMVFIFYWAQLLGRRFDVWRALGLTVGLMMIVDWQMIKEAGFWLSMAAFGGVITFRDRFGDRDEDERGVFGVLTNELARALWVSLWVTPILALIFGEISWLGVVINGLAAGVVPWLMLAGGLGMAAGAGAPMIGRLVLWLVYPWLRLVVGVVVAMSDWGGLELRFNWLMLAGYYLVLGWYLAKREGRF